MRLLFALIVSCLALSSVRAELVTSFHSTGSTIVSGSTNLDASWTVSQAFSQTTMPSIAALVSAEKTNALILSSVWPVGSAWAANTSTAKWITLNSSTFTSGSTDYAGYYVFETKIDLTNYSLASFTLGGSIGVDNVLAAIIVNGQQISFSLGSPTAFVSTLSSINFGSSLLSGINTIDFVVYNQPLAGYSIGTLTGGNPVGLRVDLSATATPVPEPSTYALCGAASSLLLVGARLRRRKQSAK